MATVEAYAQWVSVHLINSMSSNALLIRNANLKWGKFYADNNKNNEISTTAVNSKSAAPGASVNVNSCGRSNASAGTEGSFEVYDGSTKIVKISWECPWGSKRNTFGTSDQNNAYWTEVGNWNDYSGAIGTVNVEIGKKG